MSEKEMGLKTFWGNRSFSSKFLIIITISVLTATLALFLNIQIQDTKNQVHREQTQLTISQTFITSNIEEYFNRIQSYAILVSRDAEIREALYYATLAGETDVLVELGKDFVATLGITNFEIISKKGIILVATANPDEVGENRSDVQIVQKALVGEAHTTLHRGEGGWAFKGAAPIFNEEEIIGALLIGNYLTEEFCINLKNISGFDVSIVIGDVIVASSLPQENGRILDKSELDIFSDEGKSFDKNYSGVRYRLLPVPIIDELDNKIATAVIAMNMQAVDVQAFKRIKQAVVTLVVILLVVLVISYQLAKYTASPLGEMAGVVKVVAEGDLTKEPQFGGRDEIGSLATDFRQMLNKLRLMIGQTTTSSESINEATENLLIEIESTSKSTSAASQMLNTMNRGAQTQRKLIESISNQMTELSSSAQEIAGSAETTASSATNVNKAAEEGSEALKDAVNVMGRIKTSSGEAVVTVSKLSEEAKKIGNIVGTITNIAEQTNLLALNAAIEAARAGEQGRGFAVVADEVRKLAENSATSAGEIAGLIKEIQDSINQVVQIIQANNEDTEKGAEVINFAGSTLENIITSIRDISDKNNDISAATQEETASFTEVMGAMENISEIVTTTANESDKAAKALDDALERTNTLNTSSAGMKILAQELIEMMAHFKIS